MEGRHLTGVVRISARIPNRAAATRAIAGPNSAPSAATGRTTRAFSTPASTAGGPTRVMASMRRRGWRAHRTTGKARSAGVRANVPLRSIAMVTQGCSGMVRFYSGRATCIRRGRRCARTCRSRSIRASRESRSGAPTSAALFRQRMTRASCTCDGFSSVHSVRCFVHTAATGTCGCRGAGTPASPDRWSFEATPTARPTLMRASCTIRTSSRSAASTWSSVSAAALQLYRRVAVWRHWSSDGSRNVASLS